MINKTKRQVVEAVWKKISFSLKLIITVVVGYYLYTNMQANELWLHLVDSSKPHLIAAVFFTGLLITSVAFRWWIVCESINVEIGFKNCWRLAHVGLFFNNFMLGSVGGDGVKCLLAARISKSTTTSIVFSIIADRFAGLAMFIAALFIFWNDEIGRALESSINDLLVQKILEISIYAIVLFFVGLCASWIYSAVVRKFCQRQIKRLFQLKLKLTKKHFINFWLSIVLALLLPPVFSTLAWLNIGYSVGLNLSFTDMLLVFSAVAIITALPISFSGHGVREISLIYFFQILFLDIYTSQEIVNMTLVFSALSFFSFAVWSFLGGLIFLMQRSEHQRAV